MLLYSTKNKANTATLSEAVMKGLPDDNGLYMPVEIPVLPAEFFSELPGKSFLDIAQTVCEAMFQGAIPVDDLKELLTKAFDFPAPVVQLDEQKYILELFHGPSLAFKDFGARFMAQVMSYFNRGENRELTILVATSGDTGGAVAAGFYRTPGIKVVILYPSGKVSLLQEKQLTTLGHNISAIEVDGTFDDCQAMVKQAFLDADLNQKIRLSSANSINIARLIPQALYYFEAYKQLMQQGKTNQPIVFCVPSGNFGNLTAGLLAAKMGLPVHHFIAATNANDVVPAYLEQGKYLARPSVRTLSNAMDVGNPSNFARMLDLYLGINESSTWNNMRKNISGYAFSDESTRQAMREVDQKYSYTLDPHGAVGYLALAEFQKNHPRTRGLILETAHPAKFIDDVEETLGRKIDIPKRLADLSDAEKTADFLPPNYEALKEWLMKKN
jgi:threonine synthase